MKCPYLTQEAVIERNEKPLVVEHEFTSVDGETETYVFSANDRTITTMRQFADCIESDCAAWENGKCRRK